jgi:hypothetical protein
MFTEIAILFSSVYIGIIGIGMCIDGCFCRNTDMFDEIAPLMRLPKHNNDVCSICLEPMYNKVTRKTLCGHYFCKSCVDDWFKKKCVCPNCNCELLYHSLDSSYVA